MMSTQNAVQMLEELMRSRYQMSSLAAEYRECFESDIRAMLGGVDVHSCYGWIPSASRVSR